MAAAAPAGAPGRAEVGHDVDRVLLWPLVCALPGLQRAVIVLRYHEDLSESAAAEVLGCSVGTVRSQTHEALRALRRGLDATQREAVDG